LEGTKAVHPNRAAAEDVTAKSLPRRGERQTIFPSRQIAGRLTL
jgi:hypothetical protein